jgi:hypothetical protein
MIVTTAVAAGTGAFAHGMQALSRKVASAQDPHGLNAGTYRSGL